MNNIILTGNLVSGLNDGTGRATYGQLQSGSYYNNAVAVNMGYKGQDGNWVDRAEFFNIRAYGRVADNFANNYDKGQGILIQGSMRAEAWEKDGKKGINYYVQVDRVERSDRRKPDSGQQTQSMNQTQSVGQPMGQAQFAGQAQPVGQAQPATAEDFAPFEGMDTFV